MRSGSERLIGAYNGILTYHVRGMPSKRAQGKCTGHKCRENACAAEGKNAVDMLRWVRYPEKSGIDAPPDPAIISGYSCSNPASFRFHMLKLSLAQCQGHAYITIC